MGKSDTTVIFLFYITFTEINDPTPCKGFRGVEWDHPLHAAPKGQHQPLNRFGVELGKLRAKRPDLFYEVIIQKQFKIDYRLSPTVPSAAQRKFRDLQTKELKLTVLFSTNANKKHCILSSLW